MNAVDFTEDFLTMRKEWADIDAHQKTILSDDWGVGFTMHWLATCLSYSEFCDGRYFIDRLKGLGIAHVEKPPKKRGTYKCPDFVTRDVFGKYHLIECKGTQSGSAHLQGQLEDGASQKANIIFSDEQTQVGQRLAAGLFVAGAKSRERSLLCIADPPPRDDRNKRSPENPVVVRIANVPPERVADPLLRADMARHLQLGGAPQLADELLAFPARGQPQQRKRRVIFKEALERVRQSAETIEDNWLGRTVRIPLAEPVQFNGRQWRGVRLLHAISRDYIEAISDYDPAGETISAQFPSFRRRRVEAHVPEGSPLGWESVERDSVCVMNWGGIFRSELELE